MLATEMLPEFEKEAEARANEGRREAAKEMRPEGSKAFAARASSTDEAPRATRDGQSSFMAAKVFGVSGPTIQRAKRVKEEAPERVADIVSGKTTVTAVDAELREKRAAEAYAERKGREETKTVKQQPKIVKEYFDAVHAYRDVLRRAILSHQRQQMFAAPETQQMLQTRHEQLRSLMAELEVENG
jgi:hypothetical protein